jgi:hypothetical protein
VEEVLPGKEGFCAYVMSNMTDSAPERTQIFEKLSEYKPVASGGKWRNNVGGPVPEKFAFQSKYKFVIACENSSSPGYLTEKFAEAALANAIPIYWGDPTIGNRFNTRAFVNCHDFPTLDAAVERVKQIDADDALYRRMLSEPWFPNGEEPESLRQETIVRFLSNILDQDKEKAYRRNRSRWGIKSEKQLYDMAFQPHAHMIRLIQTKLKKRKGRPSP